MYNLFDDYDRSAAKICYGEYAAFSYKEKNSLMCALSESVFMLGMERNCDVVKMTSYAPLFCNRNAVNWQVDMIGFDNRRIYPTSSYYAQKLFSLNTGDVVVPCQVDCETKKVLSEVADFEAKILYASAGKVTQSGEKQTGRNDKAQNKE